MKLRRLRRPRDERGASLVLAIVFMVVVGAVGGGLLASISSGLHDGVALAQASSRDYAADAAIEGAIARVRLLGASSTSCGGPDTRTTNGVSIHVDCTSVPTVAGLSSGSLALQKDVRFNACLTSAVVSGTTCPSASTWIITAEVNFQAAASGPGVTTYVLSWSVNG